MGKNVNGSAAVSFDSFFDLNDYHILISYIFIIFIINIKERSKC